MSQNVGLVEFVHPSTMTIAGPTGCGKSNFVTRLLDENMFDKPFDKIYWYYREWQRLFEDIRRRHTDVEFVQNLPESFDHLNPNENNLVIIDDLMSEGGKSDDVKNLFTVGSHHRNASVIILMQNMFDKGQSTRTISLNSHYLVQMKNVRDKNQIRTFASQFAPGKTGAYVDAYQDATRDPFSYLLVDCRQETPDDYRLRASVFRTDEATVVYKLRKKV